jgi:acyl-homoserine lactone acylase PvdQ
LKTKLSDQVALLRAWDLRWAAGSVPTSLAVFWGEDVRRRLGGEGRRGGLANEDEIAKAAGEQLLQSLAAASDKLAADFGSWKTPWGDINRFQRLTGDLVQPFDDSGPSIPVPFTSSTWGSLASFGARAYPGTKKWYGTSGSRHFNDEAKRYSTGELREVYYYRSQLKGHTEREYHPGS